MKIMIWAAPLLPALVIVLLLTSMILLYHAVSQLKLIDDTILHWVKNADSFFWFSFLWPLWPTMTYDYDHTTICLRLRLLTPNPPSTILLAFVISNHGSLIQHIRIPAGAVLDRNGGSQAAAWATARSHQPGATMYYNPRHHDHNHSPYPSFSSVRV